MVVVGEWWVAGVLEGFDTAADESNENCSYIINTVAENVKDKWSSSGADIAQTNGCWI